MTTLVNAAGADQAVAGFRSRVLPLLLSLIHI